MQYQPYSPVYEISILPTNTGTIVCITDPSGANIFLDGVLQPTKTSTSITAITGNRAITFTKPGYAPFSGIINVTKNQTVNECAILNQIATITDFGIVSCTTPSTVTCPKSPIICPTSITPLDYINFIAIINSTILTTLTVTFKYTLDNSIYYDNVISNLSIGTNLVYSWTTNRRYSPNTEVTLADVLFS